MDLRGRVALVTGGAIRVGRALALALASKGARVAVHYNASADHARDVERAIVASGGEAKTFPADLRDAATPGALVEQVVGAFGRLDVLVNSAAVMLRTPFGEVDTRRWDDIIALNLRAPFFLAQAAGPHLRDAKGAIVNIADLAAFETWPAYIPHGLTKSGIVHLTKSLARVLAPDVRVNAIAPGTVLLPDDWGEDDAEHLNATTPLRREGTPDDVAHALLFLLEADYVTGETIIVDGGRSIRR
jgi:pteridine reductase